MNDKKKTILYLMEYPIDLAGGGQESTKTLCEHLAGSAYDAVVACPKLLKSRPSDYDFRIEEYESDENRELSKARRVANLFGRIGHFKRIIKKVKPDIIHVSMSESLITFGALRVFGAFSDIPFVYTDRGLFYGYRKHSMICIKATLKYAKRLLTTTEYNAGLWKGKVNIPITVINNTINDAFLEYDPAGRKEMRSRYAVDDDTAVIGFAGRISEEKDWGKVPGVVAAIKDAGIKFKVALVMSVYESRDEEIARSVKEGIISSIGEENLIYMQDLTQQEMAQYYYLPDFFIMTSMFESFGKAAVEAMSRKCVVLSTAVGGLPEVIGCEEDLYDMNDLSKLTGRIKELLQDPEAMEKEREKFHARFIEKYTPERNAKAHIKVYDEILMGQA